MFLVFIFINGIRERIAEICESESPFVNGEKLTYEYDYGGQLKRVIGEKANENYIYINDIQYDKFGAKTLVKYGNNIVTSYNYDAQNLRLKTQTVSKMYGNIGMLICYGQIPTSKDLHKTSYEYDKKGNITRINTIASNFSDAAYFSADQNFTYDPADQLLTARANSGNLYNVKMVYGNYGRINASNTSFKDPQTNILQQYNNNYTYNTVNPQSNSFAAESANNNNIMFEYGINGSTKKRTTPTKTECYAFNVFDNFKAYYNSESESFAYYNYDAGGDRTYKVVLNNFVSRTNALGNRMLEIEKYMLYPNGFINIDQHGNYTKHYYAETQRIASKIGNGFNDSICGNVVDTADYMGVMRQELGSLNKDTISDIYNPFPQITHLIGDTTSSYEDALFFWHGNNIASTQLITDMHGNVTQAVLYSPHGHIISKYNQDWDLDTIIPQYLFQAAEWDEQTRLYLMGVRDFSPDDGIFRSRDKLFEKKPFMSGYAYCLNNPLRFIDPDGEWEWEVNGSGYIRRKEGTENMPDRLFAVKGTGKDDFGDRRTDKEGNEKSIAITNTSAFKNIKTGNRDDSRKGYTSLNFGKDIESAEAIFNFMVANTAVEWSAVGRKNNGLENLLMTSHEYDSEPYGTFFAINAAHNGFLVYHYHNHSISPDPSGESGGIDGDIPFRDQCIKGSPDAKFGIHCMGTLYNYNGEPIPFNPYKQK